MVAVLITLNIIAALFLIGVVLLQSGKGADMGAAFGGASSTVFGASGAGNLLTKLTAASAAVFMLTSLALAVSSTRQHSVFDSIPEPNPAPAAAPAEPGASSENSGAAPIATGEASVVVGGGEPGAADGDQQAGNAGQPGADLNPSGAPAASEKAALGTGSVAVNVVPPSAKPAGASEGSVKTASGTSEPSQDAPPADSSSGGSEGKSDAAPGTGAQQGR